MQNLTIHNQNFITFADECFTIDVLGGVDLQQVEKMICTLRIAHREFPPMRYTLDLYIDNFEKVTGQELSKKYLPEQLVHEIQRKKKRLSK